MNRLLRFFDFQITMTCTVIALLVIAARNEIRVQRQEAYIAELCLMLDKQASETLRNSESITRIYKLFLKDLTGKESK